MDGRKFRDRSLRLQHYDYSSPGSYFITINTYNREVLFGYIDSGKMRLNENGMIVKRWWQKIADRYNNVELGEFVIMPDHIHGIIIIHPAVVGDSVMAGTIPAMVGTIHELSLPLRNEINRIKLRRKMLLPKIIGYFKMNAAKEINIVRNMMGVPLWQKNYYEHIIRSMDSFRRIENYIRNNPRCSGRGNS